MKLVRFLHNQKCRYGMIENDVIYPLAGGLLDKPIRQGLRYALKDVRLLCPVVPTKAICIGLNYRDHAKEMQVQAPKEPVFFMKPSSSVIGSGERIMYPKELVTQIDFEGELAVVMGKTARYVPEEKAASMILGYTIANDVTARNLQPKSGQWTISKSFDTFLPVGPWVETKIDPRDLAIETTVNGEIRQQSSTSEMIFSIPRIVSYLSKVMTLNPGDLILTGTPAGVGSMDVGDVVRVSIEGLGYLENTVGEE
ncbi:MAG TPA: fumarylacetoacetate hydrolase family protein [Firmicutes bacterium]|nr:fumarylacetoacetate hydrolase family protein [Bacillota bacterium]